MKENGRLVGGIHVSSVVFIRRNCHPDFTLDSPGSSACSCVIRNQQGALLPSESVSHFTEVQTQMSSMVFEKLSCGTRWHV